jgi:hypothetical protein
MPKVCVGNLTNSVTGSDLLANFSRAGEVLGRPAATDKGIISAAVGFVDGPNSPTLQS